MTDTRHRILCVDDEPQVLEGLALLLGRRYQIITALSGADGLCVLERDKSIAVVISDMRMPVMDGATFLAHARKLAPNASRLLLTGQTDLQSAICAVNEGEILRFLTKPCPAPQLHAAVEAALEHRRRNSADNTGLRRTLTAQIISQDALTGLASRTRFTELLQSACAALGTPMPAAAPGFALLHISLENMRDINATEGHATGDQILQIISRRLQEQCPHARAIGRWGDTEFALLLDTSMDSDQAVMADADALLARLGAPILSGTHTLLMRISIGIACAPSHARDAVSLIKYAMIAGHEANLQGGGMRCLFRTDWAQRVEHRYEMLLALRNAIEQDTLELQFQPIIDFERRRVRAFEALARWDHPVLGPIAPAQFIELAEESGDMPRLGQWILRRACLDARHLAGIYCERVAINISMQQLLHEDFFVHLEDSLRLSGLATNQLELELTETVFSHDAEHVLAAVSELRRRGISVAIDDFGTGYSSLAYLQRLPVDVIKIDRSFVANIGFGGETIIAAAQSIGRSFGMAVVVEGVEDEALLRKLLALNIRLFQGYYFGRPMALEAIEAWYRKAPFRAAPDGLGRGTCDPPSQTPAIQRRL